MVGAFAIGKWISMLQGLVDSDGRCLPETSRDVVATRRDERDAWACTHRTCRR